MLTRLSNNRAIALASLTAICVMAGIARGDDVGIREYTIPVAYFPGSDEISCKELREAAWFMGELERSEGYVAPAQPAVECRPEVLAEVAADAD